jgi:hypothetical protein
MLIEYRTIEGEIIKCRIDPERGVTISDIDYLAMEYFEKTNREPQLAFLSYPTMANILKSTAPHYVAASTGTYGIGMSVSSFNLSMGTVTVVVVANSYIPVFVGSQTEFDDNNINELFEEIVLKDCERV